MSNPSTIITLREYQQAALHTAPTPAVGMQREEDLLHGCTGICTEGGELMDAYKKARFYGKRVDWVNVREEIGDVLWYLALICRAADTTLEDVANTNIAKLRARYPDKFTTEQALNRDLATERAVLEGGK
jgi:NTP pyrophosphatase (non-canonical NTP hydrolase)